MTEKVLILLVLSVLVVVQSAPTCPEGEEFRQSGTACQTCENYAIVFCLPSEEKKCNCKVGYVRDNDNGNKCVPKKDCTKDYFHINT
ncbi:hypothetical protein Zmor_011448 [Zophobas morio]|uniref:TIL domain-containing protein n=1 Tax=Zophobas morio TaxID=2755281 RepID=A0AA38IMW5_9CUCU|nr:hypothetical protein Zmor_011448 [Zophobas morio]